MSSSPTDAEIRCEDGKFFVHAADHEHRRINSDCIIGVNTSRSGDSQRDVLMYAEILDEPEDAKVEQRIRFKSSQIYAPAEEALHKFHTGSSSFWKRSNGERSRTSTSISVIISTGSGGHFGKSCFTNLLQPFLSEIGLKEGTDYTTYTTESAESIIELTRSTLRPRADSGLPQSIILLSGDGGIVDLVNGLLSPVPSPDTYARPQVAIIPCGTGNALANSTGVLLDRTMGLSTLFRGSPRPLPIFKVTMSSDTVMLDSHARPVTSTSPSLTHIASSASSMVVHGAVVFSYGFHATLVSDSDTPEYRKHGAQHFQMAATDLLFPPDGSLPHSYSARVSVLRGGETDWRPIERESHAYVLVTLVSHLEAGFTISPATKPLDGRLRLVEFGPMGGDDLMGVMQAAYGGGTHIEDDRVGYEEVEGIRVEFDSGAEDDEKWRRVCVDGKIFAVSSKGSVTVEKESTSCLELLHLER